MGAGTDDKPSLHKRNGLYYLSWSSFYDVSHNLSGPYTYKGLVIEPAAVAPEFRNQKLFHDRHGNFFEFNGQWYYMCNDKSQPGRSDYFRDSILSYVHYHDNGDIAPICIDAVGVGEYDAKQPRIEAEDYFKAVNAETRDDPAGGFEVRNLKANSSLVYPKVVNLTTDPKLSLRIACAASEGVSVEIHEGDSAGKLLGSCKITPTGGWTEFQTVSCGLKVEGGARNLCFVVHGARASCCVSIGSVFR